MKWDMSSVLFFTDSTTVLWWLRTHKELDVFVGNRVCKILDGSGLQQWFHVATGSNPADIPTRGLSGKLLAKSDLWWEGPEFFTSPRREWPKQPEVVETRICSEGYRKEEKRRTEAWCQLQTASPSGVDPRSRFPDAFWLDVVSRQSNVKLAMGVACRVFEFLGKFKRHNWSIHRERLMLALQTWVFRAAQAEGLPELLQSVESGNKPPKEFAALDPMLDQYNVLRLGGRLRYASRLPQSVRCPVILSGKHKYSHQLLYSLHAYELQHCGGRRTLMAESRWQVWISGLSRLSKAVTKNCTHCAKSIKQLPIKMDQAPLHYTRLPLSKGCAFSEIGIDMAGPFYVKRGRGRAVGKCFILLFSCCWTRALNVEVMDSASTESCVFAFLRHCNVYGFPQYVNSDRGTNLTGMDRHYKEQWEVVEKELSRQSLNWPQLKWRFNPPYSPRFSGHVEIMVKITKVCLRKILGQPRYLFRDEELCTLVKVAQGYANLRPLSEPSEDPNDPPPLVPADFLMTGSRFLGGIPEIGLDNYPLRTRKEMLGKVTKELWQALTSEYILELQKISKERGNVTLKPGDIVLLLDKNMPSGKYCLGKVVAENLNPDGRARSFVIKHKGELIDRSIMTLAPLLTD